MKHFFFLAMALMLTACAAPKVVTVTEYRETIRNDTVELMKTDSVYVSHYVFMKGDTVHMRDTIYQYRVISETERATEYVHDSIPYPVEVVREVRRRNFYDKFTAAGFWIFVAIATCIASYWIGRALAKIHLRL